MMKTAKLKLQKKERKKIMKDDYNMDAFIEISAILTIAILAMVLIATY
jgi:hypothetical protein